MQWCWDCKRDLAIAHGLWPENSEDGGINISNSASEGLHTNPRSVLACPRLFSSATLHITSDVHLPRLFAKHRQGQFFDGAFHNLPNKTAKSTLNWSDSEETFPHIPASWLGSLFCKNSAVGKATTSTNIAGDHPLSAAPVWIVMNRTVTDTTIPKHCQLSLP